MRNFGLSSVENSNADNFTTKFGLKARRVINRPFRFVFKKATKGKVILERYPKLKKGKPYIFASTHSHIEDVISNLSVIDRNAYTLIGTTDQLRHNPQMYMAWANGMIYVDRYNEESRHESVKKMKKLLESGTSVLIFVEGGYNNSEHMLLQKPFPGVYKLNCQTGVEIVPISNFLDPDTNNIYIKVGDPIDLSTMDKGEALQTLRDVLATMVYEQIFEHTKPLSRSELGYNPRSDYLELRRKEYWKVKWSSYDAWKEEMTTYKGGVTTPEEALEFLDNVKVNSKNASFYAPLLARQDQYRRYSIKKYMEDSFHGRR